MTEAFFDGACWPNPGGPAGAGALVKRNGVTIYEGSRFIEAGNISNNCAEYEGLILLLEYLKSSGTTEDVTICGDSQMVIRQMRGEWKIRKKESLYVPHALRARQMADDLSLCLRIIYKWVPRAENTEADALSNKPLIERGIRNPYA